MLGVQYAWYGLLVTLVGAPDRRERGREEVHVAVALQQSAPLLEIGHVDAVDECADILLQQHLGPHVANSFFGTPKYGTASATTFLDTLSLACL